VSEKIGIPANCESTWTYSRVLGEVTDLTVQNRTRRTVFGISNFQIGGNRVTQDLACNPSLRLLSDTLGYSLGVQINRRFEWYILYLLASSHVPWNRTRAFIPKMGKLTKYSLTGLTIVALLVFVFVIASRAYTLHQARILIGEISSLDKASDPTAASLAFMQEQRGYFTEKTCDREFCQYRFVFTNRLLSMFHLAARSKIEVLLYLFHERLESVAVAFTSDVFRENSPVVYVQEDFCKDRTDLGCDHFAMNPHGRNVTPTWNGIVEFGQLAKEEQRRAAWTFNIDCLQILHGCRDISELKPIIWKRTSRDRVSSRMRSTADSTAEGAEPLAD
jgi:hypothetical protein